MSVCETCGGSLPPSTRRPRKFCSERCRKRQYDLQCVDCGGRVSGTDPGSMANPDEPRCLPCANDHKRIWTRDAVILAIREWADENGGIPPSALDWNKAMARAEGLPGLAAYAEKFGAPENSTVVREFGSWNKAIRAAGLEPRGRGERGGRRPDWQREAA